MSPPAGVPNIRDDEVLYRRVPELWYAPDRGLQLDAFRPTKADHDGLSLSRDVLDPTAVAAAGRGDRRFWVAELAVADVRRIEGVTIVPDAVDHACVLEVNWDAYNQAASRDTVVNLASLLMGAVRRVTGPYPGQGPIPAKKPKA